MGTLLTRAEELSSVTPGAADLVSLAAAGSMARWSEAGGLLSALQAYQLRLQEAAAAYRQGLDAVLRDEEEKAVGFNGTGVES